MHLIIDTTQFQASVALAERGKILRSFSWKAGFKLSNELLPKLLKLRVREISRKGRLKTILIIQGPGSFTGTRIGIATANALAFSWDIPVCGVSNFDLYKEKLGLSKNTAIILKNIHSLVYANVRNGFAGTVEELAKILKFKSSFIGEIDEDIESEIKKHFGKQAEKILKVSFSSKERLNILAKVADKMHKRKNFSFPLKPIYIAKPNITIKVKH